VVGVKDTSYRDLSLGPDVVEYLRIKSKRLTPATQRDYESCLDKLARHFDGRELLEFEPPDGARLVESFLAAQWGDRAPRTYNKNLAVVHDFFLWQLRRGALRGDPTLNIERAKPRSVHRTTFNAGERARIMAVAANARERVALKLLLDYGLRKGALQNVRFEHFDFDRRRIRIFTKGEKIHQLPIPDEAFWKDLESITTEPETQPRHYLLCRQKVVSRRRRAETLTEALDARLADAVARARRVEREIATPAARLLLSQLEEAERLVERTRETAEAIVNRKPEIPMGEHGLHDWWYRCLARAGIVQPGVVHGQRMHKARHSAGQRVLDKTGNLKATQALLCHANIGTTGDNYVGWETEQLEGTMREVLDG
jgi:site-specific recombinase XerC